MKSVYMINGFMEAGKTEFITFTLGQPYFQIRGTTLLIVCEKGKNEFDPALLRRSKTIVEMIDEEAAFTPAKLVELEKKHKPDRIVIEYNGMWNYKDMKLPWYWKVEQQITLVDGSTFPTFYADYRSLFGEMIRKSELIIINRCDGIEDLGSYKRIIKSVNASADVIFEGKDGEINEIFEEDLPYDLNQDVIELDNEGYGIWYLDSMDHLERYIGKTISFPALVAKPDGIPDGYFIPGRMAMTCCADDMAFLGYVCEFAGAGALKQREWVKVKATVAKEYWKDYEGEGPVLHAITVEKCKAPKDDVITFN